MSKKDTDSVKYILEEMDPAEKIEFEREMAGDPDLHIEVESIRRMKSKLSYLPDLSPPEELSDSIIELAADRARERSQWKGKYFLSAAVMILGITTGSFLIENPLNSTSGETQESQASVESRAGQQTLTARQSTSSTISESSMSRVTPWVDRQNVIHLNGFGSGSNSAVLMELGNSFDKLKPVGRFPSQPPFSRSLQLTGSNR